MNFDEMQNDPFLIKFIQSVARMLGEWYQTKSASMTNDELYDNSEFFPAFNSDRDYSKKPEGYICRAEDGTMLKLIRSPIQTFGLNSGSEGSKIIIWKALHSKNPAKAREYSTDPNSPYTKDEVCVCDGIVYKCVVDETMESPKDEPENWEQLYSDERGEIV